MASKSAILKLLEEKYKSKSNELDSLRRAQTKDLCKQRDERKGEIFDYIKSQVITLVIPCASSGKKKLSATFSVEITVNSFNYSYNITENIYMKDPTYSHLSNLIGDIEKAAAESLSQLAKQYRSVKESIILTGVPENIKDLLSKFEGL